MECPRYNSVSNTPRACFCRYSFNFFANPASPRAIIATANSAAFFAPASPIANVATGIPAGICTVDNNESIPFNALLCIGTPSTGRVVLAAITPARCAAPPAPAIIHTSPRISAFSAYSIAASGVRCADNTRFSYPTPNSSSTSAAFFIVSQSDLLPITIPTRTCLVFSLTIHTSWLACAWH